MKHAKTGSPAVQAVTIAAALTLLAGGAFAQTTAVGLSTVRSLRLGPGAPDGAFVPQPGDAFGVAVAVGDFDHNGTDDLATGMPGDGDPGEGPDANSGTVVVRFSTPGEGVVPSASPVYIRQAAPADLPEPNDYFGAALAACDFDGDGSDDLAIGIPGEDHLGRENAGAVELHLGANPVARAFFTESTPGIPGDVEDNDAFGSVLACGDFDADGFADLAVGVPGETFETAPFTYNKFRAGMAVVIPGFMGGLDFAHARPLHQDVDGIAGDPDGFDEFGSALAAGDLNGDGFDDLAVGVPGEDDSRGVIQIVFGSPSGLAADGDVMWSQSFLGGYSEDYDDFGSALGIGDFDGNGVADLAIGVPHEAFGPTPYVGQVHVVYGFTGGPPDPATAEIWTEDVIYGPGNSEENDAFGDRLAAGDFDHDGHDDLVIVHGWEGLAGQNDGAVTILMGTSEGLSPARHRRIAAGLEGFPGDSAEDYEFYGSALGVGDFDGDGHADLAIGVRAEDDPQIGVNVGSQTVLYGALFADGVENGDTGLWSQTVQTPGSSRVTATAAAKLGPTSSKLGLQYDLTGPTPRQPGPPTYVRAGTEAGFLNETHLAGTFFVDPRALSMSPTPGQNVFQMIAFQDVRGITRLTFDLNRNDAVGGWALIATFFNETTGALTFAGGAGFAALNEPAGTSHRIDFDWTAGNPGALKLWQTTYVGGVPNQAGRVPLFTASLPSMPNASISNVLAGMVSGQDLGTFGSLYLDELSFRR